MCLEIALSEHGASSNGVIQTLSATPLAWVIVDTQCGALYLEEMGIGTGLLHVIKWHHTTCHFDSSADEGMNRGLQPWESFVLPAQPRLLKFVIKVTDRTRQSTQSETSLAKSPRYCLLYERPPLGDKVSMLTIYTHTKPGGRLKWSYAKSPGWQPTLCVARYLICWFALAYKKYDHTWHRMSLLRPGVIKQHKPSNHCMKGCRLILTNRKPGLTNVCFFKVVNLDQPGERLTSRLLDHYLRLDQFLWLIWDTNRPLRKCIHFCTVCILIYQGVHCCIKVCNIHPDISPPKSRDNRMHWTRCNLLEGKGIYENYEPFKGKGICLQSRYPRYTCSSDFTFLLAVGAYGSLQLPIQPWICAPGTHYGWVDQGSVEYEVCLTLLHMASTGNRTDQLQPIHFTCNGV